MLSFSSKPFSGVWERTRTDPPPSFTYPRLPSLPFRPSCRPFRLFPGFPHSRPLQGFPWVQLCQEGRATRGRYRRDVERPSLWSRTAGRRRHGRGTRLPSTPTSSALRMQTARFRVFGRKSEVTVDCRSAKRSEKLNSLVVCFVENSC